MGVGYRLVNIDKKEEVGFCNVNTGTKLRELSGTIIASNIVTYYLLINAGDRIGFINDTDDSFNVCGQKYQAEFFSGYIDVTNQVVDQMIEKEIIQDNGIIWIDKEDNLFDRDLRNIWDPLMRS
jgi:hypothetical protein